MIGVNKHASRGRQEEESNSKRIKDTIFGINANDIDYTDVYNDQLCSIKNMKEFNLVPFMRESDTNRLIGPEESIIDETRRTKFAVDTEIAHMEEVANELDRCGRHNKVVSSDGRGVGGGEGDNDG